MPLRSMYPPWQSWASQPGKIESCPTTCRAYVGTLLGTQNDGHGRWHTFSTVPVLLNEWICKRDFKISSLLPTNGQPLKDVELRTYKEICLSSVVLHSNPNRLNCLRKIMNEWTLWHSALVLGPWQSLQSSGKPCYSKNMCVAFILSAFLIQRFWYPVIIVVEVMIAFLCANVGHYTYIINIENDDANYRLCSELCIHA